MGTAVCIGHDYTAQVIHGLLPASHLLLFLGQVVHDDYVILIGSHLEAGSGTGGAVQGIQSRCYGLVGDVVRCQCHRVKGKLHLAAASGIVNPYVTHKLQLLQIVPEVIGYYAHGLGIGALDNYPLRVVTHTQNAHEPCK